MPTRGDAQSTPNNASPAMSVVIVTAGGLKNLRNTLRHLHGQTAKARLEIIFVAPSRERLDLKDSELKGFCRARVIEVGEIGRIARATATGVREARAPVVATLEDHCYPAPGWAHALIEAHRQPWSAVGGAVGIANPAGTLSRADHFMSYGRWFEPPEARVVDDLPLHNSSYKRAILLGYGGELETMIDRGGLLHRDLRAKGQQLYLEPAAKVYHLNVSQPWSWIRQRFYSGRLFAANRTRNECWSLSRRLVYIAGAPLIPLMHLRYILPEVRRTNPRRTVFMKLLAALVVGLEAQAAGEAAGYSFGPGRAATMLDSFDLHRTSHLRKGETVTAD